MKTHYHRPLFIAVAGALRAIFQEEKYADKVVESTLRSQSQWGSRDRAFIAEQTYDAVRWWRLLWFYLGETPAFDEASLFRLIAMNLLRHGAPIPLWPEMEGLTARYLAAGEAPSAAIAHAIPDWLDATGRQEMGEAVWYRELEAMNRPADIVLRVNTLKTTVAALQSTLAETGWNTMPVPDAPDALRLLKRGNIFQHPCFRSGLFEVQDAGSQRIAPFLEAAPGMRVVDACAGAGGKTLHLATLMHNKGHIIALDTESWKLEELQKRARRNGIHNIETRVIQSTKVVKRLYGSADRILLDVPCSGSGVWRRNPDARWKLTTTFLDRVRATQASILDQYAPIARPGGRIVYATCSIFPSENQQQVSAFLERQPAFSLLSEQVIYPSSGPTDGFYMALIENSGA